MNDYAWATLGLTVKTGKKFYTLPENEREAILLHEWGHICYHHGWHRFWWVFSLRAFFQTEKYFAMCETQEFVADAYAKRYGFKRDLIAFLQKLPNVKTLGYPLPSTRIQRLEDV